MLGPDVAAAGSCWRGPPESSREEGCVAMLADSAICGLGIEDIKEQRGGEQGEEPIMSRWTGMRPSTLIWSWRMRIAICRFMAGAKLIWSELWERHDGHKLPAATGRLQKNYDAQDVLCCTCSKLRFALACSQVLCCAPFMLHAAAGWLWLRCSEAVTICAPGSSQTFSQTDPSKQKSCQSSVRGMQLAL